MTEYEIISKYIVHLHKLERIRLALSDSQMIMINVVLIIILL